MIQGGKIVELRIELLVDAISKCHMAVATRKRWKEIQASMDAVEIAWDRIKLTSLEFGSHDLNLDHLPMMVEMVLRKATKYLAKSQAKMEKWWEGGEGVATVEGGGGDRRLINEDQGGVLPCQLGPW